MARISSPCAHRIWQKSFYDHIIRSEHDYREIWTYIDNNPAKWSQDKYNTV